MSGDPQMIYSEAFAAAKLAVAAMGPEDTRGFNCGFAWVTVRPARGTLISWCKKNNVGSKSTTGGWNFWNPGQFRGQHIDHHYAGAQAFAEILARYGLRATAERRLD